MKEEIDMIGMAPGIVSISEFLVLILLFIITMALSYMLIVGILLSFSIPGRMINYISKRTFSIDLYKKILSSGNAEDFFSYDVLDREFNYAVIGMLGLLSLSYTYFLYYLGGPVILNITEGFDLIVEGFTLIMSSFTEFDLVLFEPTLMFIFFPAVLFLEILLINRTFIYLRKISK